MGFLAMLALAGAVLFAYGAYTGRDPLATLRAVLRGDDLPGPSYVIGEGRSILGGVTVPRPPEAAAPYEGRLIRPVSGPITSPYGMRWGRMHEGVDIGAATGTPVKAAASGRVTAAGWNGGYGNWIKIVHTPGLATGYAHLSSLGVRSGQAVGQGATIGQVGSTGDSTGPHLHFEVHVNGRPVNPLTYIDAPTQPRGSR